MSNNDSIDEETKRILTEVDSNDSNESKSKKKDIIEEKDGYDYYYEDTRDKLPDGEDSKW